MVKRKHYDNLLANASNKTKSAWQLVNNETRRKKLSKSDVTVKNGDGDLVESEVACNLFNDYFLSVPTTVISDLKDYRGNSQSNITKVRKVDKSIFMYPVTENEICKCIDGLKNKNSSGYDFISNNLLKRISRSIVLPLVHIINLCFEQGVFPEELKIAKVVPVYKKGEHDLVQNYRPISILTSISKIFETVILTRLNDFFFKSNILSPNQFGFLKGRSTIDAITSLVESVVDGMESGNSSAAVFLDLTAAFDCVDRQILMAKLSDYGVRGKSYDLILSYLTNRKQFVSLPTKGETFVVNEIKVSHTSDMVEVEYGVPQGSILGPFLYIVYTNSLVKDNFVYADDTTSLTTASNTVELEIEMFVKVNELTQELAAHNLKVNSSKTSTVYFKPSQRPPEAEPTAVIDDKVIDNRPNAKFLGLLVDSQLNWSNHVDMISARISSGLFVLRNIVRVCSSQTALSVYYALIQSHISYGITVWGSCSNEDLTRILKLQKRAVRYLCGLGGRDCCRERFGELGILTVPCLYILEICLMVKKNPDKFIRTNARHGYQTRNTGNLEYPLHRTTRFELKPSYRGIRFFNKLPDQFKAIGSIKIFKKELKTYLLTKNYYCLNELP